MTALEKSGRSAKIFAWQRRAAADVIKSHVDFLLLVRARS